MNFNPIIIVGGEPQSVFFEIFLKAIKKKSRHSIILVSSKDILKKNIKRFKRNLKLNVLNANFSNIKKGRVNLVDINYKNFSFSKKRITNISNTFIEKSFDKALEIIKKKAVLV